MNKRGRVFRRLERGDVAREIVVAQPFHSVKPRRADELVWCVRRVCPCRNKLFRRLAVSISSRKVRRAPADERRVLMTGIHIDAARAFAKERVERRRALQKHRIGDGWHAGSHVRARRVARKKSAGHGARVVGEDGACEVGRDHGGHREPLQRSEAKAFYVACSSASGARGKRNRNRTRRLGAQSDAGRGAPA